MKVCSSLSSIIYAAPSLDRFNPEGQIVLKIEHFTEFARGGGSGQDQRLLSSPVSIWT